MPLTGESAAQPTYINHSVVVALPDRLVHIAFHRVFGGPCVQKTVSMLGMPDALMLTEPQLIEQLDHRNIVKVREAQFDPVVPMAVTYVMPFYMGGSVQTWLERGHVFSVHQTAAVMSGLLDALAYLHAEVGFVHRDVKPANVLLNADLDEGFLSDFGSAARILPSGDVSAMGWTLPYRDPASTASGRMTVASDIYGAGLTMFEMLSGTLLPRLDPAKATIRLGLGKRAYPDSCLVHSVHVPDPIRRVINKAIAVEPGSRYLSAADMATALDRARRRVIDWNHVTGSGLDGEWQGSWPFEKPMANRRLYRVQSGVLAGGAHAGERLLEAAYYTGTKWRRFGRLVEHVGASDHAAVARFFRRVDDAVAQIKAAR